MNNTEIGDMLIDEILPVVRADAIEFPSPTKAAAHPPTANFLKRNVEPGNSPLRICHVLESCGGSGQVVLALARHGLSRGDDVTLVYSPDRADPAFVTALSALPGLKTHSIPMQRKVGRRDIVDGWRLYRLLRRIGPFDIIHGHSSKAGALARIAGIFLPGATIYTPHGFYSMMPDTPAVYGMIERLLSYISTSIVAVSFGEFRHGVELGISSRKLALIPNGATPRFTLSREEARRNLGIHDATILFGFVGRMEPQKNPIRAIAAFAEIAAACPDVQLVMIGDGQLREKAMAERSRLNMEHRIDLLGHCDSKRVIPAFDCLICSSEFETLPISFLESLSAGVPIVTVPVGGVEEAVIDGVTGFAARYHTVEALADATGCYVACTREQRREMAENARRHAIVLSAEIMGEKYRALYQRYVVRSEKARSEHFETIGTALRSVTADRKPG
jgi:glycosyltransferase involved in cell wall biosynthesis